MLLVISGFGPDYTVPLIWLHLHQHLNMKMTAYRLAITQLRLATTAWWLETTRLRLATITGQAETTGYESRCDSRPQHDEPRLRLRHRLRLATIHDQHTAWLETMLASPVATRDHTFWALVNGPDWWASVLTAFTCLGLSSWAELVNRMCYCWLLTVTAKRACQTCWTFVHYLVRIWLYVISVLGRYWLLATWLTFCVWLPSKPRWVHTLYKAWDSLGWERG